VVTRVEVNEKERNSQRRGELRREFGSLYDVVLRILFEADPAGINFETNTDEYEPEGIWEEWERRRLS
jgi:hypothetical protein